MYDFKPPYFGSAYYPESWPREQIDEDLDLMVKHGLNTVRIAEFAWAVMEPREGVFDLSLFREVVDKCKARGISVIMCTPSACPPSWMEHKYPDILMQAGDRKAIHGNRRVSCPTNRRFRDFCGRIAEVMGREFAHDENIIGWQIDNELGPMTMGTGCTCPSCAADWHDWLRRRYGSIDALNDAWGHYTWSLKFSSFDEVDTPTGNTNLCAAHMITWREYKSETLADFCHHQARILRRLTKAPIGTDMMPVQNLDYDACTAKLDVVQYNHYSGPNWSAMWFDYLRTLKDRPFWVTETSTCWNGANRPEGPRKKGYCRANTLMSFAAGSEMTLYWLYRSHWSGHEMGHGSVIDAWGRPLQMMPEVEQISRELDILRPYLTNGAHVVQSGLAMAYFHMGTMFATHAPMNTRVAAYEEYVPSIINMAQRLHKMHLRPDMISPHTDLTPYRLLFTHRQYTLEEGDFLDRILPWVEAGGTWVVGPMTDIFTKHGTKYLHAPFGHLEDWAHIKRLFYAPAPSNEIWDRAHHNMVGTTDVCLSDGYRMHTDAYHYDAYEAGEGVTVLGRYAEGGDEYLTDHAAITETRLGKGRIIMLGCQPDEEGFAHLMGTLCAECGIAPIAEGSKTIQNSLIEGPNGTVFTAIEVVGREAGYTVIPFDATDLLTGRTYTAGERVEMKPFDCIFAKKN